MAQTHTPTLVEAIADGLEASVDGRGFNADHQRAFMLANAAPAMLEALRLAFETYSDITSADFSIGKDRPARDAMEAAIAQATGDAS